MSHMICDGHGNQLADGMGPVHALWRARELANHLGMTVYVYGPGDTDETATPIAPEPVTINRITLRRLAAEADAAGDLATLNDCLLLLEFSRWPAEQVRDANTRIERVLSDAEAAAVSHCDGVQRG